MSRVGIVIPTFKESQNIASLITEIHRVMPQASLFIIDDSPDNETVDAAKAAGHPDIEIVHRARKDGRGSAALLGLRRALARNCDTVVEMDSDFSHAPSELPTLLDTAAATGTDVLIASRYRPDSRIVNWPFSRRVFSRFANLLARALLHIPIRDYTNGYRVYSRAAAEMIAATCGRIGQGFIPLSEILVNVHYRGLTVREASSVFVNRSRGVSSVTRTEIMDAAVGIAKIYLLKRQLVRKARVM
jgi:dolichol-phosphate mannosyltransferase